MRTMRPAPAVLAILAVASLALTGCSASGKEAASPTPSPSAQSTPAEATTGQDAAPILAAYGLDGLTGEEVVDRLDAMPVKERPKTLMASVRSGELQLSDTKTGANASMELPEDKFYLSVAPFVSQTHECFFHSLTTCLGEEQNKAATVKIADTDSGKVYVQEETTTFDNGFKGYWLPAGKQITVTVTIDGKSGTVDTATSVGSPTCLTSLQLS